VLQSIGGSTNGIVHLAAIAGRLGIKIDLDEFDEIGRNTQVLVDLKPSGENYMDDMHKAGGTGPLFRELSDNLVLDAMTVNGKTLGENIADLPPPFEQTVIRTKGNPISQSGGMAVLKGNLAPDRAVIKHVAASPELLLHTGKAVVFKNMEDLVDRIDSPDLDVDKDSVLVMQNAGPKGAPGMPESGYLPIPKKLLAAGVKDMVRISDARMSGTAFGTIVLHVAPESAIGGPLALVKDGDMIKLDVENRSIDVLISNEEMAKRRANWTPPPPHPGSERGYSKLYQDTVNQAPDGADFDFLQAVKP
jgi:dihydroxy-acid dehydratase